MPTTPPAEFFEHASALGIEFEPGDVERFGAYLDLLLEANASFNLTTIVEPDQAWMRHIFDSLTLMQVLAELPQGARVADVGSGGGAPAIPLAIAMPHLEFTLIEATGKKADFLRRTCAALALSNVRVVADRAESIGQDHRNHREAYDAVLARALGRVAVAVELTTPLARVGGVIALIKGQKADEEIAEAKAALHALLVRVDAVIPTPTGRIVVIQKTRATPRVYPRRPGEPKRAPLGVRSS